MPYALSIPQDWHCRDTCKCRCGYWQARDVDNWTYPPTNPEVTMNADATFYNQWFKDKPKPRTIGDIWSSGDL